MSRLAGRPEVEMLTPELEAAAHADILQRLHTFARETGATPGDDVLRWFDGRLRSALERQEKGIAVRP